MIQEHRQDARTAPKEHRVPVIPRIPAAFEPPQVMQSVFGVLGLTVAEEAAAQQAAAQQAAAGRNAKDAPVAAKDKLRITKVETYLLKPRWLFLKIHTNAGITGLGEPVVEGRALTCQTAIKEIEPYLVGKDPRAVAHHWQAIYRHAFYRGGPVLTSALSGIDQALWDIKGKALGVPVYELLGGPTRNLVRVYSHARTPEAAIADKKRGFTAFRTGPAKRRPARYVESPPKFNMRPRSLPSCARPPARIATSASIFMEPSIPPTPRC